LEVIEDMLPLSSFFAYLTTILAAQTLRS